MSHVLRELQIKTIIKYHCITVRTANGQKIDTVKFWWACGMTGILIHCWWQCKMVSPLWKRVWQFLKKSNIVYYTIQQSCSEVFMTMSWKLCPHKNLHTDVYRSFIDIFLKLEEIKKTLKRRMDKQIHIMECSVMSLNSLVTQLCQTLRDPMDCSTPGLPVRHQLPELA